MGKMENLLVGVQSLNRRSRALEHHKIQVESGNLLQKDGKPRNQSQHLAYVAEKTANPIPVRDRPPGPSIVRF